MLTSRNPNHATLIFFLIILRFKRIKDITSNFHFLLKYLNCATPALRRKQTRMLAVQVVSLLPPSAWTGHTQQVPRCQNSLSQPGEQKAKARLASRLDYLIFLKEFFILQQKSFPVHPEIWPLCQVMQSQWWRGSARRPPTYSAKKEACCRACSHNSKHIYTENTAALKRGFLYS